jgi:excisionase family DNA binding protein
MTLIQSQVTGRAAYSIAEVCANTGLGRDTIYRAIRGGRLIARKIGRRTIITHSDLRRFLEGLSKASNKAVTPSSL